MFRQARQNRRALFFPYICVGYPDVASSIRFADAALSAGASGLELGVPFSDPIADGPTLQKATHQALEGGVQFKDVFHVIRSLRAKGHEQPLLVMTYLNPVVRMGWDRFSKEMADAGANGAIVPDLPLEEFAVPRRTLLEKDLSLIPFLAPTSSPDRARQVDALGAPFLYYVSVTGVTGARRNLPADLSKNLRHLRSTIRTPVTVGFGISNPQQAAQVGRDAEGVIIASALIQVIEKTEPQGQEKAVAKFCRDVVRALQG
jgi:tryptophan synthase alpha chain